MIILSISPSELQFIAIYAEYEALTGSDNQYEFPETFEEIYAKHAVSIPLPNMTMVEARVFAEPIRIALKDQCITLTSPDRHIVSYTSWAEQLEFDYQYPTHTKVGAIIMATRIKEIHTSPSAPF